MNRLLGIIAILSFLSQKLQAQGTQNLVLEKIYLKWLVDSSPELSDPSIFCWNLEDRVLEGDNLPSLKVDTSGPRVTLDLEIGKTKPECHLLGKSESWTLRDSSKENIQLRVNANLPFSRIAMEDSRGRKIELLVEARFSDLKDSGFLSFFRDSVFSLRGAAIRNKVWQIPFLLTKYELPTLLSGHLALEISLGQSLFDFSGAGLRQGYYELALATPVFGSPIPYESPLSVRLRVAYEGVQVNDQNAAGVYPLLASQMVGGGVEGYFKITPQWGIQAISNYYFSKTSSANLGKIGVEGSLSYALSERWRLETGMKFLKQSVSGAALPADSGFNEFTYFTGISVKPYLGLR